jgi:hypothetical protein
MEGFASLRVVYVSNGSSPRRRNSFWKTNSPPLISFQPRLPPIIQIPNCECVHKRGRTVLSRRQKEKDLPYPLAAQAMSGQSDALDDIAQRRGRAEVLSP